MSQVLNSSLTAGDDGDGVLEPGETWTYSAPYDATQANIDNGADIVNEVTFDIAETDEQTATATTTITPRPAFSLTNVVDQASISAPGSVTYMIKVANTGNAVLSGYKITDTLTRGGVSLLLNPSLTAGDDGDGVLEPGEIWTYSATYDATQANIDNGADIVNEVTFDTAQTDEQAVNATNTVTRRPAFSLANVVDPTTITAPATLTYTIKVANTGNVSLTSASWCASFKPEVVRVKKGDQVAD
jgi:uncharacterized repeat protein (TIGR01451 family)